MVGLQSALPWQPRAAPPGALGQRDTVGSLQVLFVLAAVGAAIVVAIERMIFGERR